ncbi:D-glycerate 3-kinase [Kwoniella heveanensis CBS 569]|uniref:D-glycerate 3-kinase n=1 Tax=Kwoniella heveanensis BCC8398 TaxID=1296120 RepID=A0A1B9GIF0_9TREE|nr:D-glycerate 3-kinase [Kwoniella heveanensis BCC8398]OCF45728.1 D-glycerate 3-kinase [Kwoniella heveanensis CBS 569]
MSLSAVKGGVQKGQGSVSMVERTEQFVLAQLTRLRKSWKGEGACPPLVIGVQGPQGAGKSYLTNLLPAHLAERHSLRLATMSLDDFYLPHSQLSQLASSRPGNPLLQGRGPAGTHDLPLLRGCLEGLREINSGGAKVVQLPTYDKSLVSGQGDRTEKTVPVQGPIDVVIFEGWMNGFASLSQSELEERYASAEVDQAGGKPSTFRSYTLETLSEINRSLKEYEENAWRHIDCFVQIQPLQLDYVWTWRLQQEHHMKSQNGGIGMTDEEVRAFIQRYMPSYELFQFGIDKQTAPWSGKGLRYIVDIGRNIVDVEDF